MFQSIGTNLFLQRRSILQNRRSMSKENITPTTRSAEFSLDEGEGLTRGSATRLSLCFPSGISHRENSESASRGVAERPTSITCAAGSTRDNLYSLSLLSTLRANPSTNVTNPRTGFQRYARPYVTPALFLSFSPSPSPSPSSPRGTRQFARSCREAPRYQSARRRSSEVRRERQREIGVRSRVKRE